MNGLRSIDKLTAQPERLTEKYCGLTSVYDQNYPLNKVDFSSLIRAIRATKPDVVYVASYPLDSSAIIRSASEIGIGSSVKMFGGGMVGLQNDSIMESLGPALNGIVNYHVWVPEKSMDFTGLRFLVGILGHVTSSQRLLSAMSDLGLEVLAQIVMSNGLIFDKFTISEPLF